MIMRIHQKCTTIYSKSFNTQIKCYTTNNNRKSGLVLGIYNGESLDQLKLTKYAEKFNNKLSGNLLQQIKSTGPIKSGAARIFWNIGNYPAVAVANLGDSEKWSKLDELNGSKENCRIASAAGSKALLKHNITNIHIEDMDCAQSAAEGATLGVFKFQDQKSIDKKTPTATIKLIDETPENKDAWQKGIILANAQNWARTVTDTPANLMTPSKFMECVRERCEKVGVQKTMNIEGHDVKWAKEMKMNSFLSVTNGSVEPALFLELSYNGCDGKKPICLVGKGITFDSGGISIKPSDKMELMRGDMGGGAIVAATIIALAENKVPVNVKGFIPLTENLPSGTATKPGDVIRAMNGKSICVDNTDAEGRLVLSDALCYADTFKPEYIVDIATLTGAISVALGDCVAGAFCNDNKLWNRLHMAGMESGDRLWRMPLFKHYTKQISDYNGYDLNNMGKNTGGGACKAAAFLREFVSKKTPWVHIDMAGIMYDSSDQPYICRNGMTGRPTRTVIEFICQTCNNLL